MDNWFFREANGYKNGNNIEGKMFPKLWSLG